MLTLATCTLRPFRAGDEDALVASANDPEVARNLRDAFPHPYTRADADGWIAYAGGTGPGAPHHRAILIGEVLAGAVGVTPQGDFRRRSVEIGYWLGRSFWGRGIATDALRGMTDHVFATMDVCRIFAPVFESNPASARVLEKAGYVLEARLSKAVTKHGVTMDELHYARVR